LVPLDTDFEKLLPAANASNGASGGIYACRPWDMRQISSLVES
jgi:hypothetical protein